MLNARNVARSRPASAAGRRHPLRLVRTLLAAATVAAPAGAQARTAASPPAQPTPLFFSDVRVFDGTRLLERQNVLVRDGRIAAVGRRVAAPAGAQIVRGEGKTLLPGLIDAHVHAFGDALEEAVGFGVTTAVEMFGDPAVAATRRAEQAQGRATQRADVHSAGVLVTAPGGHGTQFGLRIPTLAVPESAQAFVDARIAEGSDFIKIVLEDGGSYGQTIPTLDTAVVRAAIAAAHRRGRLAVVHVGSLAGAHAAVAAGADALVHLFVDRAPDPEFGRAVARSGAFVIPTLTVLHSVTGVGGGASLLDDPQLAPHIVPASRTTLAQGFPRRPGQPPVHYAAAEAAVRQLRAAGVAILAGTDAGNPGTSHGAAMHGELALLVRAGLTPAEALTAATSAPARAFRLTDRGRIAAGLRADLLLVEGDPTRDVTATRAIAGIWKAGVAVDRERFARTIAARDAEAAARLAEGVARGDISDFDDGTASSAFGAGWMASTDAMAGGKSTVELAVAEGGAEGSARALALRGTVAPGLPFAWAGTMFTPGAQPMAPVNLSARAELRFWARGDGRTYRVMLFTERTGMTPIAREFVAGPEWQEHVFAFRDFAGSDGRDVLGIVVAAGPQPGPFELWIDQVRLR